MNSDNKFCLVTRYNHFDATWRRCWNRQFTDSGNRYISYRELQREWFKRSLDLAKINTADHFMSETTWSTRHFLETDPNRLPELRQLIKERRFEQLGAGENIIDTNLVNGETIVRNFMIGMLWSEKVLGVRPTTGFYRDAFGTSAQLPQIFRQCGLDFIPHMDYNTPDKPYWKGIDGSIVLFICNTIFNLEWACVAGHGAIAPCNECHGEGCSVCDGRGYSLGKLAEFTPRDTFTSLDGKKGIMFMVGNEENMPGEHIEEAINAFNKKYPNLYAKQGIYDDLRQHLSDELTVLDNPSPELTTKNPENNPCITGVYVSRIKMKQLVRKLENLLISTESKDTLYNNGKNHDDFYGVWQNLTFYTFHDAVTSSCCDESYYELLDMIDEDIKRIEKINDKINNNLTSSDKNIATVINITSDKASSEIIIPCIDGGKSVACNGQELTVFSNSGEDNLRFLSPEINPFSSAIVTIKDKERSSNFIDTDTIKFDGLTIEVSECGITQVTSEQFGIISPNNNDYLFGELILEHDEGCPWSTRSLDRTRERLKDFTQLDSIQSNGNELIITYKGQHPSIAVFGLCDPNVIHLKYEQRFILKKGIPILFIESDIDWYTINRRLKIAFPTASKSNEGIYNIPYGHLKRDRYEPVDIDFITPDGDWPAVNWAGIELDNYIFALLNNGTPSYRIEDGVIFNSILRSPASPGGILQPQMYITNNFSTITDPGKHNFRHGVYLGEGNYSFINSTAALFNHSLEGINGNLKNSLPVYGFKSQSSSLTSVKRAEKNNATVFRIVEMNGKMDNITLKFTDKIKKAFRTNILEDILYGLNIDNDSISFEIKPFEIATVIIES